MRNGTSQYDYLEVSRSTIVQGQARIALTAYLTKWDHTLTSNPNQAKAIRREVDRQIWRQWYKEIAAYDLRMVHNPASNKAAPRRPDDMSPSVAEIPDMLDFIDSIQAAFATVSAGFFDRLNAFRGTSEENLMQFIDRFDEVSQPLLTNKHTTARNLAFVLRCHIPPHLRRLVCSQMDSIDRKRYKVKQPGVDKEELVVLMREEEAYVCNRETEQRAAGVEPDARETDATLPPRIYPKFRSDGKGVDRDVITLKDRLGVPQDPAYVPRQETRACDRCKQVGHIAKFCPLKQAPPAPPSSAPPPPAKFEDHRTQGAVCSGCKKPGHVEAQCWAAHPDLRP